MCTPPFSLSHGVYHENFTLSSYRTISVHVDPPLSPIVSPTFVPSNC